MWISFTTRSDENVRVNLDYIKRIYFRENKIFLDGVDFNYEIYEADNEDFHIIMRKLKSL